MSDIPSLSRRVLLVSAMGLAACGLNSGTPPIATELDRVIDQGWHALGLSGAGVSIGVIDAGFGGFREDRFTSALNVRAAQAFVPMESEDFFTDPDDHGTNMSQLIGGRTEDTIRGLAHRASYWLAKGEEQQHERRTDEEGAIAALDWMVSEGVKIINISLGYTNFDDAQPYSSKSMDGQTNLLTQRLRDHLAADPMLIAIVSAGNQGSTPWRLVTAPGDAREAITVGSAQRLFTRRRSTSGIGNPNVDFIKPDVVIPSGRGAGSVAAAVVTGLVGCLREKHPDATRAPIAEAIAASGSNTHAPHRTIGFGIPAPQ